MTCQNNVVVMGALGSPTLPQISPLQNMPCISSPPHNAMTKILYKTLIHDIVP